MTRCRQAVHNLFTSHPFINSNQLFFPLSTVCNKVLEAMSTPMNYFKPL